MRIWQIGPNAPSNWNQSLVKIQGGRRIIDDFVDDCETNECVTSINVTSGDESIKYIIDTLELNKSNYANTLTIYEDLLCCIQVCYQQDFIEARLNDREKLQNTYNYFSSIINNDVNLIFGNAIFTKTNKDKQLVDLTARELFSILANIYFFTTYQVRDGELAEITILNSKDYVDNNLKDMSSNIIGNWEFYMPPTSKGDITSLGIELVDINDYNNLIVLKKREITDISAQHINLDKYTRGIYQDLSEDTIKQLFTF